MRVCQLFISPGHNFFGHHEQPPGGHPVIECAEIRCLAGRGIVGDRFLDFKDNYKGQITFISGTVFEDVCHTLGVHGHSPGVTRRNVVVAGVELNALIGVEFDVQGVRFMGTVECSPCYWMDQAIAPGAELALRGRGGLRARILTDGTLRTEKPTFSAVILAGGQSSRMGRDKAWLECRGQTLLERQIDVVRDAGAIEIVVSGRADETYGTCGRRVLMDAFKDAGPLAGIERALDAATSSLLLVLAVDLPDMNRELLQRLSAYCSEHVGVIPRVNGNLEPLTALYPKASQYLAERLLREGRYAVATFAEQCVEYGLARFVDLPASNAKYFTNWNAPADFAAASAHTG